MDTKGRTDAGAPLDDVMLAMDVVDTLRHRSALVERELGAADREKRLMERLRELYASQGIDVPDRVLAEGVAALDEERFAYRPPPSSFAVRLARIYVDRGTWARRALVVLAVVLVARLAFHLGVTVPERRRAEAEVRRFEAEVRDINGAMAARVGRREALSREVERLRESIPGLLSDAEAIVAAHAEAEAARVRGSLDEAASLLATAARLGRPEDVTAETAASNAREVLVPAARRWLAGQDDLLGRAEALAGEGKKGAAAISGLKAAAAKSEAAWTAFRDSSPDAEALAVGEALHQRVAAALRLGNFAEAEAVSAILSGLKVRTEELRARRDAVRSLSLVPEAAARAGELYANAIAGLRGGDVAAADRARAALDDLMSRLAAEYTIRIVSRPGESSGVWRIPDRNPSARNYYIVVEAVSSDGRVVRLPIRSEEDGRSAMVSRWGLRVSKEVFETVRADKADDGIIQNDVVGVKRRGVLEPEYTLAVQGGAITRW